MDESEISCICYPTTVVIVDDNKSVLDNIQLKIGKYLPCETFSDPKEALTHLKKSFKKNKFLQRIMAIDGNSNEYAHVSSHFPIHYDVKKIFKHAQDVNRFTETSVIVVDYAMPGMNGEELCKELKRQKDNPVKIIMLTGELDEPIAIRLFNEGIIDIFLRKARPGVDEELKNNILALQSRYFQDLTYPIIRGIASDKDSALGDPIFRKFFHHLCCQLSATSYYLIETSGSFVLFDNVGKTQYLITKTLNELKEIANQIESHISGELVDAIAKGELIPYFDSTETEIACYSNEQKLRKSLYKAQKLTGKKTYCYTLLDELPKFLFNNNKITSFNQYMCSKYSVN